RINNVGTCIGRPASDAPATARIEPDSHPAGTPTRPNAAPPAAANASVSPRWRNATIRSWVVGADNAQSFRDRADLWLRPGAAINAAWGSPRQMQRLQCRPYVANSGDDESRALLPLRTMRTRSAALRAPILSMMRARWTSTVRGLI